MGDQSITEQITQKSESWKQLLAYFQVENTRLKTHIAEIGSRKIDSGLLADLENFQNHFLRNDELIALTRTDLLTLKHLAARETTENGTLGRVTQMEQKLEKEMRILEQKFDTLRQEFNHWLAENGNLP